MNSTIPVTENVADLDSGAIENEFPNGDDLAISRATDFYGLDELLTGQEREMRDRVRQYCDTQVAPVANEYWERAEFPVELAGLPGARRGRWVAHRLRLPRGVPAGRRVDRGRAGPRRRQHRHLQRRALRAGDDRRSGCSARTSRSSAGCRRWPAVDKLGAFALTEPEHGSDVVAAGDPGPRRPGRRLVAARAQALDRQRHGGRHRGRLGPRRRRRGGRVRRRAPGRRGAPGARLPGQRIVGKAANRAVWQAQIELDGVRMPADARLAQARTWDDTNTVLAKSRQTVAWEALGHAVAAYEAAVTYALRREQFGRPLARFQLVQDKLSHMLADITGMQTMCTRMSQLQAEGPGRSAARGAGQAGHRVGGPAGLRDGPGHPGRQRDPARPPRGPPPRRHRGRLHLRGHRLGAVADRRPRDHRAQCLPVSTTQGNVSLVEPGKRISRTECSNPSPMYP